MCCWLLYSGPGRICNSGLENYTVTTMKKVIFVGSTVATLGSDGENGAE
jgi:hypothetical protein